MVFHAPVKQGPQAALPTEWDRNIRRAVPKPFDHAPHNQSARLQHDAALQLPRIFKANRRYLGNGSAQVAPFDELVLPKSMSAHKFLERLVGVTEGEAVELLPEGTYVGYRDAVTKPEKVYVYRRSQAKDDFVIPPGRIIRVRLRQTRAIFL